MIRSPISSAIRSAWWPVLGPAIGLLQPTFRIRPDSIPPGGTFSRGTSATQVNADGSLSTVPAGVLRTADYSDDPTRRGIKIEPQATNRCLYSDDLSAATWIKSFGQITRPSIQTPRGLVASNLFTINTANNIHRVSQGILGVSGVSDAFRVLLKSNGVRYVYINADSGWNARVVVDLVNGATAVSGVVNNLKSNLRNDGFVDVSFSAVSNGSVGATWWFQANNAFIPTDTVYVGDGVSGFYVEVPQLETGSVATSYIPTAGAAVTRGADVWKYPVSVIGGWNTSQGTLFFDEHFLPPTPGKYPRFLSTGAAFWATRELDGRAYFESPSGNDYLFSAPAIGDKRSRVAIVITTSAERLVARGVSQNLVALTGWPISADISIGASGPHGPAHSSIYALDYYPQALPAARLQALTAP